MHGNSATNSTEQLLNLTRHVHISNPLYACTPYEKCKVTTYCPIILWSVHVNTQNCKHSMYVRVYRVMYLYCGS